jgi:uncharacterized Fe-S cluster-containing radical SAM superfamily protein
MNLHLVSDSLQRPALDPAKFRDPEVTATGARRAEVALATLGTLWFNTGTLCNLTCVNCYVESSPTNDRLAYLSGDEVADYLDEIERTDLDTEEIGFTGGEPFMNPDIIAMIGLALARGFRVVVLTNAMRPMMKRADELLALRRQFGERLTLRVSIDHYSAALHESERGRHAWERMLPGLAFLREHDFNVTVAGRTYWPESEADLRRGFGRLFAREGLKIDADNPLDLVLFPEMDEAVDVPEITEACWDLLGKSQADVMCSSSRMVAKRKGAERPAVLACTLLPYEPEFELGATLAEASAPVKLNHPHCAKFCVLGGGACSAG